MNMQPDASQNYLKWGRVCLITASCAALYQCAVGFGTTPLHGCGNASGCHDALASRWAYSFGLPVGFMGLTAYVGALLFSGPFVQREARPGSLLGAILITAIIAAALWFSSIQYFDLGALCWVCTTTHICAVGGAILLILARGRVEQASDPVSQSLLLNNTVAFRTAACAGGLLGLGLLVLGSLTTSSSTRSLAAATSKGAADTSDLKRVSLFNGKVTFDPAGYPSLGTATAGSAVLLSDYTCKYCREYAPVVTAAAAAAGRTVIMLPVARTEEAEGIQKIMLTMFHADTGKWAALSESIHNKTIPAELDAVAKAAMASIGSKEWAEALRAHKATVESQMKTAAEAYEAAGSVNSSRILPLLLNGDKLLSGAEEKVEVVTAFLKDGTLPQQQVAGNTPGNTNATARFTPDSAALELGSVAPGNTVDVSIPFTNRGGRPLRIDWSELEEDCRITESPGREILPSGKAKIGLKIKAPVVPGAFTRVVRIHTNGGEPVAITVRGVVKSAASTQPGKSGPAISASPTKTK